ncbi:MAG: T9SS type A sorting domain-containing protein [Bacteroidia bacterium]|nr:T9SS type A sorting domain-containing protein [Bacteroidia bacterium]
MKKIITLVITIGIIFSVNGFSQVTFQKYIGGSAYDEAYSIIQTGDGGYAVCGYTQSYGAGSSDVYVVKLDGSGNIQWTKTIGGSGSESGGSIIQTTDGGYAIGGYTNSFGAGGTDVFVIKFDGSGNIQWSKTFGGSNSDGGNDIVQTSDGGYAIGGYTQSFGAGGTDAYVIKLDSTGSMQWTKTIGGSGHERAYSIIQSNDGGYALAGYTGSFGAGSADIYFVKLDGSGNLQATRTIGGSYDDRGNDIIQTQDGGYAIAGSRDSSLVPDMYVVKLSSTLNVQWKNIIGDIYYDAGYSIVQNNDGSYMVCGYSDSYGGPTVMDFYVVKLSSSGNLSWTKCSGPGYYEVGYSIVKTSDGGYAACGTFYSMVDEDIYIVKMDVSGNTCANNGAVGTIATYGTESSGGTASSGGAIADAFPSVGSGGVDTMLCSSFPTVADSRFEKTIFNLSPNPATNQLTIESGAMKIERVEIYDVLGRLTRAPFDFAQGDSQSERSRRLSVDVSSLAPGIYFLKARRDKRERVMKFVKE